MTPNNSLKKLFELAIDVERFKLLTLAEAILATDLYQSEFEILKTALGPKITNHIFLGLIRFSFLIELVKKPKIDSTKYEVRWAVRLGKEDPRFCEFEECLEIFNRLLSSLIEKISDTQNQKLLRGFTQTKQVPYEIPVDYCNRVLEGKIHTAENVMWYFGELPRRVIGLRQFLLSKKNNSHVALFVKVYKKTKVKTYLTDRVLTGLHKTNREKRWETHPLSVHFALRRTCQEIEYALLNQICHFEGVPPELLDNLNAQLLLNQIEVPVRCPITLEKLFFSEFESEIVDPKHGRAGFQVGHLNPLKAINDDPTSGHTALNISWMTENGNRIQGSMSLADTRAMIKRIYQNYERFGV